MAPLSSKNPSFLIILFVVLCSLSSKNPPFVFASQECIHDHFSALLHLKHGFNFSNYVFTNLSSWNSNNTDCCSWDGITCDGATGHVIGLDLGGLLIKGRVDFESLFHLRSLKRLDLAFNAFDPSPFPSGFGQLTSLTHLDLSFLSFYGQIPLEISHLTSLVSLDLSFNSFAVYDGAAGYFPYASDYPPLKLENPKIGELVRNLSSLRELYLDYADISAQGGEWGKVLASALPNLSTLSLSECGLSGPIHSSISQLHFLSQLDLSNNNLSSAVPTFVGNFSFLTSLRLQGCGLHGNFPEIIFRLPNLQILDISENPLLTSYLPEFPQNNTLQQLILSSTGFSRKLPDSLANLKFLTQLELSNCNFSGSLPSVLVNLSKLEYLDLSFNSFSGPIPSSYGNELPNLVHLWLKNNLLNGTVPPSLFSLPSLQWLVLKDNQLSGQLGELHNASSSQLKHIYLDNNNLQGMIPRSIFQLTKLKELYVASNNFSGVVDLGLLRNLKKLYHLDLSDNNLSVQDGGSNSTFVSFPQIEFLWLRSCNISTFPNFLRNQEQLSRLDLSNNKISGEIPKWLWEVGNGSLDYLNLSHNALQGIESPFPHLLLSALQSLDLSSNMLESSLPIPSPSVIFFSVSNNRFRGEIPLSVCNATSLTILDLSYNHFIGRIPACLGENGDVLTVLNLQGNAFNGTLPQTFKKGCNIQTLDLSGNHLEGQVPRSLANCKMLELLNIGNNRIHGTFPLWLEALSQLRILILRSNQFHGTIGHPLTNHSFPLLQILDLSSNSFEGNLPSNMFKSWKAMMEEDKSQSLVLGKIIHGKNQSSIYYQNEVSVVSKGQEMKLVKILTAFTVVDLSKNKFQGEIPESFGDLKLLHVLNMSYNHFMGQIPASFGNIKNLESLDLSQNKLSGEIPQHLTDLTFLAVLNLSQNLLVGKIPQIRQFLTFDNESFKGNLELCGLPLSRKCKDDKGTPPSPLSPLQSERKYDWELIWIGFGVGYGAGVGMLFWTLALWRNGRREFYIFMDKMLFLIFPSMVFAK